MKALPLSLEKLKQVQYEREEGNEQDSFKTALEPLAMRQLQLSIFISDFIRDIMVKTQKIHHIFEFFPASITVEEAQLCIINQVDMDGNTYYVTYNPADDHFLFIEETEESTLAIGQLTDMQGDIIEGKKDILLKLSQLEAFTNINQLDKICEKYQAYLEEMVQTATISLSFDSSSVVPDKRMEEYDFDLYTMLNRGIIW